MLATDNAAFALDIYKKLILSGDNVVFSPASISIAMAMVYAGAAGTTASEMAATLHYTLPPARLHPAFNALDLALSNRGKGKLASDGGPMRVSIQNAVWAERDWVLKTDYLDTLAINYGAGVNLLNFSDSPEASREIINAWVAEKTEDRIHDLLPLGSISSATRLVLTNTVYLNAAWAQPFDTTLSRDGQFTRLDGQVVTTKFMGRQLTVPAGQGEGFTAVSLPYADERLSMVLLVPDAGKFAQMESALSAAWLTATLNGLTNQSVILSMPRFRLETKVELAEILKSLGMTAAFLAAEADFSGMDGTRALYLDEIHHKAMINLAEKGTEAAAATAATMRTVSLPMGLDLNIDRPFLYFLRDNPTGAIVFMGRMLDPSKP
jgi:serpin B